MQHLGSFLVYEPVIRELAARGHTMHLAVSRAESLGWEKTLEQRARRSSAASRGAGSRRRRHRPAFWFELAKTIRLWADYLRYFEPYYAYAPKLQARAEERVPPGLVRLSQQPRFQTIRHRRPAARARCGRSNGRCRPWRKFGSSLREHKPDVVLVTPLVYLGSWQFEVLRAALAEGLRTAFAVGSWDHLSSKALIRDMPQRVLVWNETQKHEAVRLHGVPADRIVVTGAQCYDQWFGRAAGAHARGVLSRSSGCPPIGRSSCTSARRCSGAVRSRRSSSAAGSGACVRARDPELRVGGDPGAAASGAHGRVEGDRSVRRFDNVALYGSNPMDADVEGRLFRIALSTAARSSD